MNSRTGQTDAALFRQSPNAIGNCRLAGLEGQKRPSSVVGKWLALMSVIGALVLTTSVSDIGLADETAVAAPRASPVNAPRGADWIRTGESRYGWKWLAERFDKDGNGVVSREEVATAPETFVRLDRSWDGFLTADDFDWSQNGVLCQQKETAFALFKSADVNSDGRISAEEWQAVFAKAAKGKEYVSPEELEQMIYLPRVVKTASEARLRSGQSEFSPEQLNVRFQVPKPGDMAPDFKLHSPDGKTTVQLSAFKGKQPVVLIFGCFSCGNYRTYSESLEEMYQRWHDDVAFVRVYVREAHAVAEKQRATPTNAAAGILIKQPSTLEERCSVAERFVSTLGIRTPVVVDELDNRVGERYGGWPDRLYVVDKNGVVAFAGGPGPFGFNPRETEQALALLLIDQRHTNGN